MTSLSVPSTSSARPGVRRWGRRVRTAVSTASGLELLSALPLLRWPVRYLDRHPVLHGAVLSAFGLRRPMFVDHLGDPQPRYGYGRPVHPQLAARFAEGKDRYRAHLSAFRAHLDAFRAIPLQAELTDPTPYWGNGWLPPLDALALTGFLAETNPRRYLEIGSGNSTKFARRAIADHGLRTTITSIDPSPRAEIDALCDTVIREPLEHTDLSRFDELEAGDIVFFDGSHRAFMGSDVTVFFFEVLPRLRPGVLVHIHDILLPSDYPPEWRWRAYSEQYLLAAFLLADRGRYVVELPNAYIADDPALGGLFDDLWAGLGLGDRLRPSSFWLSVQP
ncbi:class I SAM-dependent methyltransferase [Dactylosporangium sp. CA-139066]|uniref:class I SAM-dependent methyltransferase n=1 Tax=Dactylosporangium sp. CA-139066 TaxID=3239930 RepID=UPI003D9201B7